MYDKDGSGSIELPEMIEIIGTLYEMEGVPKVTIFTKFNHTIIKIWNWKKIQKMFTTVDIFFKIPDSITNLYVSNWETANDRKKSRR